MFSHFDIVGILLGVDNKLEEKYGFVLLDVLTEWVRNDVKSEIRNTMRVIAKHDFVKTQLATCRRGDLIIAYGNIVAHQMGPVGHGIRTHELQLSKIQRLVAGYAHHASGKCERGGGPTMYTPKNEPLEKEFLTHERDGHRTQPAGNARDPLARESPQEVAPSGDRGGA